MEDLHSLLSKGESTTIASVANNVIDKISAAIGYVIIPKGKRKHKNEATEYLIARIKEDPKIPELAKAAMIANAKKIIKEYSNQQDVVNIAIQYLSETANADNLDQDWLDDLIEKSGNISDEQVKDLFGRLIAEACNGKKVSKSLTYKLCLMDHDLAVSFEKLCKYMVEVSAYDCQSNLIDKSIRILYFDNHIGWSENFLLEANIFELSAIGLVSEGTHYYTFQNESENCHIERISIRYGNEEVSFVGKGTYEFINEKKNIICDGGSIYLTKDGQYLAEIIGNIQNVDGYLESVKKIYEEEGFIVS